MKPRKLRIELPAKVSVGNAVRLGLADARAVARHNARGVRASGSPEFLHQLRVAVRAARALIAPLRRVYDVVDVDRLGAELTWLARLTGPPRDLDVLFEQLPRYSRALTVEARADLAPFQRLLDEHRRKASEELIAALDSKRFRDLMKQWKRFARRATRDGRRTKRPAKRFARAATWRRYRKTRTWLTDLHADSTTTDVHRARIELKKLRYLIEFFGSLFPVKAVGRVVGPLKAVQDTLGTLNDLAMHRSLIRRLARSAEFTHLLPADTIMAMGELSANLESDRRRLMSDLMEQLEKMAAKPARRRFRKLYRP